MKSILASLILLGLFCSALSAPLSAESPAKTQEQWLFIASPAKPTPGIYACTFNPQTGEFGKLQMAAENVSTGFLALHPTLPILYAGTVEENTGDQPNGFIRAYEIDAQKGTLRLLGKASTNDVSPTHIEVARNGKSIASCHYSGAGTTLNSLAEDGSLKKNISQVKHSGSSTHPRQKGPHPHGVAISHCGNYVCVADLGNDHVEVFRITEDLELKPHSFWKAASGAGPRHVSFHPNGQWLYCINELDNTMSVLDFDHETGQLKEIETVTTLPADFDAVSYTSEVVVHPNGQFLYGSNRGHNSTVVFAINPQSGKLSVVEYEPTQGDHPRHVSLDRTGTAYVAANMNANNLVSFRVDTKTGALEPTGNQTEVTRPMCVVFVDRVSE